jgi:hypothetical protein
MSVIQVPLMPRRKILLVSHAVIVKYSRKKNIICYFLQAATTGKKVESRARPQLKGAVLPAKVPLTPSLLAARGTVTPSLAARGTVTPSLAGRGTATPSLAARGAGGGTPALPPPSANVRAAASKTRRSLLVSSTPLRPPGDLFVARFDLVLVVIMAGYLVIVRFEIFGYLICSMQRYIEITHDLSSLVLRKEYFGCPQRDSHAVHHI